MLRAQEMQRIENTQHNMSTNTNSVVQSASIIRESRDKLSLYTLYDPFLLQDSSRQTPR